MTVLLGPYLLAALVAGVSPVQRPDDVSTPQADGHRPSVRETFPQSARVQLFIPNPLQPVDADYLGWISGADSNSNDEIKRCIKALAELDGDWVSELFTPLIEPSIQFVKEYAGVPPSIERANALEQLMKNRGERADALFAREGQFILARLLLAGVDSAEAEAFVSAITLAREADVVEGLQFFSVQLGPNILRLLHSAAQTEMGDTETKERLRQLALDFSPRVLELRRSVGDACLKSTYRGASAIARALNGKGESDVAPTAKVFRPVALAVARVAALNREVLASVQAQLPPATFTEVESRLLKQTYGPLAVDPFDFDVVKTYLLERVHEADLAHADEAISADLSLRRSLRDHLFVSFDLASTKFLASGLVRDEQANLKFVDEMLQCHKKSEQSVSGAIAILRAFAEGSGDWDGEKFNKLLGEWREMSQRRITDLMSSGMLSAVAPTHMFPH